MRVVLDTNVVVSGFLSPSGKPSVILRLVLARNLDICINTAILTEYEQVLRRAKFLGRTNPDAIQRFFAVIYSIGFFVDSVPSSVFMPDENDRIFYDLAKESGAYLITGNKKHYPQEAFVHDPASFLVFFASL